MTPTPEYFDGNVACNDLDFLHGAMKVSKHVEALCVEDPKKNRHLYSSTTGKTVCRQINDVNTQKEPPFVP